MSVRYSCPAITRQFQSGMHDERNLELGTGEADGEIVERVLSARKPVGFVEADNAHAAVAWALRAIDRDLPCSYAPTRTEGVDLWVVSLAAGSSPVGELVDVPAAISDYRAWFGSERELLADIERHLTHLATVPLSSFIYVEAVEIWEFGSPPSPGEWAHCGLLLGYPLDATAALIAVKEGIPGFSYESEH